MDTLFFISGKKIQTKKTYVIVKKKYALYQNNLFTACMDNSHNMIKARTCHQNNNTRSVQAFKTSGLSTIYRKIGFWNTNEASGLNSIIQSQYGTLQTMVCI